MYRVYWIAWGVLLMMTITMIALDQASLPHRTFVMLMLGVMSIKAGLIAAVFMHLRSERWPLVLGIVVGLPVNAAILYVLIAPDAQRIFGMLARP